MKARLMFVALMLTFVSFVTAQEKKHGGKPDFDKAIEIRVKRMQQSLMLEEKQSAEFAVIYKEFLLEMAKCRPAVERGMNLTDAQIKKNIEARMDARQKALDIEKKYYGKLSKILNARQLEKVFDKNGFNDGDNPFNRWGKGDKKHFFKHDEKNKNMHKKKGFKKPGVKDCKKGDGEK